MATAMPYLSGRKIKKLDGIYVHIFCQTTKPFRYQ
jgi:hypothetical protein